MNKKYTDANGTTFTDEDIERLVAEHESKEGYTGPHGPIVIGRPISVGEKSKPFTLRLDIRRRAKLDKEAEVRRVTPSQLVRDLIDAM